MRSPSNLQTGAKGKVNGAISSISTWEETFEISANNLPILNGTLSTWEFTFKRGCSTQLTLTSGSEITVTESDTATVFAIETDDSIDMCGDYHADLIETRNDGTTVHWLHGIVTFNS